MTTLLQDGRSAGGVGAATVEPPGYSLILASTALLLTLSWLLVHSWAVSAFGATAIFFSFTIVFSIAAANPLVATICLIALILYQNLVISILSPAIDNRITQTILLGTNFIFTIILCAFALLSLWCNRTNLSPSAQRTIAAYLVFLALCAVYLVYGSMAADVGSALAYFRNFICGASLLIIGYAIGMRVPVDALGKIIVLVALPAIVFGYLEWAFPSFIYDVINAVSYLKFKFEEAPARTYTAALNIIEWRRAELFNLTGIGELKLNIYSTRLFGTLLHPISFGYALCAFALIGLVVGNYVFAILCLPLLLISGTKGPLIVLFGSVLISVAVKCTPRPAVRTAIILVFIGLYVVSGIIQGNAKQDFHVIGFQAGLHSLFANPLGHGLGVGGNLSIPGMQKDMASWQESQRAGVTEFAIESAVGTMFYQLGVGSLLLILLFLNVMIRMVALLTAGHAPSSHLLLPIALGLVVANGVFQEEAFAPAGLGLIALFCGAAYANLDSTPPRGTDRWMGHSR